MLKIPVTKEDHIQGDMDAPISLLEYGDYECSYCGLAYPIVKRIQKHFGKRLRFVFRNFPLVESHPHAGIAAMAAEFASLHHQFWEMHDLLYENQHALDISDLLKYAKSLNLSVVDLKTAIENETFSKNIKNDFLGGVQSGVNGTPTFFINGNHYKGSFEYEDLLMAIEQVKK